MHTLNISLRSHDEDDDETKMKKRRSMIEKRKGPERKGFCCLLH